MYSLLLIFYTLFLFVLLVECVPSNYNRSRTSSNYTDTSNYYQGSNFVQPPRAPTTYRWDQTDNKEDYYDLDYYLLISDPFEDSISKVMVTILSSKEKIIDRIQFFPNKLIKSFNRFMTIMKKFSSDDKLDLNITESSNKTLEAIFNTDNINDPKIVECKTHLPNTKGYTKSFELFAELLLYEFQKSTISLEQEFDSLKSLINSTKDLIIFERSKAFLKKTAVDEVKIWERETIQKLYETYFRIWKITISLSTEVVSLGQREEELEQNIVQEIRDKLTKFACCYKTFDFQVNGVYCNP